MGNTNNQPTLVRKPIQIIKVFSSSLTYSETTTCKNVESYTTYDAIQQIDNPNIPPKNGLSINNT